MKVDLKTAARLDRGQQDAILIKIAEQTNTPDVEEAVKSFLRGDFILTKPDKGYEIREDGLIILTLTSHGHTGPEQKNYLKEAGYNPRDVKNFLNHKDFTHTKNGDQIQIGILTKEMMGRFDWTLFNARLQIEELGGVAPTHDIGGLLLEKLSDYDIMSMGLEEIYVSSHPLKDFHDRPGAVYISCRSNSRLLQRGASRYQTLYASEGCAFVLPQP